MNNLIKQFTVIFHLLVMSSLAEAQITNGLWSTSCLNGQQKMQIYNNNQVILIEQFYLKSECHDESLLFQTSGFVSYNIKQSSFIDFTYEEISLSLNKQNIVEDFNSRKVCGLTTWVLNQPKNITGLNCALFNIQKETQIPKAGDLRYGIYLILNSKLYYGQLSKKFDGSSPENRPTQINASIEYILKNSF